MFLLLWAVAVSGSNTCFSPTSVSLLELRSPSESQNIALISALQSHGLIQVTGLPDFDLSKIPDQLRECQSANEQSIREETLPSGAVRVTLGLSGLSSIPSCVREAQGIRRSVDAVTLAFSEFLYLSGMGDFLGQNWGTMVGSLDEHKDHVHWYKSSESSVERSLSEVVPFHTDKGIFLVITQEEVLTIENSTELCEPVRGSLLVLIGEGLPGWFGAPLKACRHGVRKVTKERSVFARMVLAKESAESKGVKFANFLSSNHFAISEWERLNNERCANGGVFCWHQCMERDCGKSAVCWDKSKKELCKLDIHNPACSAICPPVTTEGTNDRFCLDGSTMLMEGFEWSGRYENTKTCIILFFNNWVLNTQIKFWFACLGVFLLGAMVEGVVVLRKRVLIGNKPVIETKPILPSTCCSDSTGASTPAEIEQPIRHQYLSNIAAALLFGLNLALAYLIMLVAMTYSGELFIAVVLGLVCGHVIWKNQKEAVSYEAAEPCCVTAPHSMGKRPGNCHCE